MNKILITGGAGFIGSHVLERIIATYPDASITILDKMTYAADYQNIVHLLNPSKCRLIVGDVCDLDLCLELTRGIDCVIHMAAESHVDNSFGNSLTFTRSNALGTHTLLEAARVADVKLFVHVSTDEVYGEIDDGEFTESSPLLPSNPYSGSKAAADMIVHSYVCSFKMPVIKVRSNNIFGIRQYPEKIIPRFALQKLHGKPMSIHGDGSNRRRYLAAEDFAEAIATLIEHGKVGEIYNIGTTDEFTNLEIAGLICESLGGTVDDSVTYVGDRPFNDSRYAVKFDKISALGWKPRRHLQDEIHKVTNWYRENQARYQFLIEQGDI